MKQALMSCASAQMGNLANVDAKELGEVIDMIKDLEEAIYYCTITKAMNEGSGESSHYHYYTEYRPERDMDKDYGRMYYDGRSGSGRGGSGKYYTETMPMMEMRDPKEGRSYKSRKSYMESKEMHKDKTHQMKELEKYMQELSSDMVEMIEDATPEERQYLEKRVSALAQKIGQVNG